MMNAVSLGWRTRSRILVPGVCQTAWHPYILPAIHVEGQVPLPSPPTCGAGYTQRHLLLPLPWWLSGKETACQCRRHRFNPLVWKIPWKREWQPTTVFLPGKSHGQRNLAGYSPWGCKRVGHDLVTKQQTKCGDEVCGEEGCSVILLLGLSVLVHTSGQ